MRLETYSFRHSRVPGIGTLYGSAARPAKMCPCGSERTTLAAKPAGTHGDEPDRRVTFGGTGPDQRNKPADNRPAEQQIHQKDFQGVGLVPANNGGQKIQERR